MNYEVLDSEAINITTIGRLGTFRSKMQIYDTDVTGFYHFLDDKSLVISSHLGG